MGPLGLNVVFTIITSEYMTSHKRADIIVQKYEFDFGTAGFGVWISGASRRLS